MSRREREQRDQRRASAEDWAKNQGRDFEPTAVKLPEGTTFFKLERVGTYEVDFIEYVAGKGNPRADEGYLHFEREYCVHRIPMPNGRASLYCCLYETFKKKCPVCEYVNANGNTADKELIKSLKPQVRHLWNVIDRGSKEQKVQVFDSNHFNRGSGFGEQIADALLSVPKYRTFARAEGGYTLHLTVKELALGQNRGTYKAVTRVDFVPREKDLPDDIVEQCVCLDDCLIEHSYDELKRILLQEPVEGKRAEAKDSGKEPRRQREREPERIREPEQERPQRRGPAADSRNGHDDDDDAKPEPPKVRKGDRVRYKKTEYDVIAVADGGSLTLEDDDGNELVAISPEYVKVLESAAPAPKRESASASAPTTKSGKSGRRVPDDDDDDDDDDAPRGKPATASKRADPDDDDDEEPAPPKRGRR